MLSRRTFLNTLAGCCAGAWLAGPAWAIGDSSKLELARLKYQGGNWQPRGAGLRKLLLEVEKRTSIEVGLDAPEVAPDSEALFDNPFTVWSGDAAFDPLPQGALDKLAIFLRAGGFLLVDGCEEGDTQFEQSVRRELARILPDKEWTEVPAEHVLYKSFYLLDQPYGRRQLDSSLQAIELDGRLAVVFTSNDLQGAWERDSFGQYVYDVEPGGEQQRESAFRFGINLVMYAFCQTYKEDQVHVPFILKRRKWRVD